MSDESGAEFLCVPMRLDALSVNREVLNSNTFRRWRFSYSGLSMYKSPEPAPFGSEAGSFKEGIYLHWNLPGALRTGKQVNGALSFPLVPNRWLVTRRVKDDVTAWVLESDCPLGRSGGGPVDNTSPFVVGTDVVEMWKTRGAGFRKDAQVSADPSGAAYYVNIGIAYNIKDWYETAPDSMFLTAAAPSNAEFCAYIMNNSNIFSFYDDLAGIDKETVSYHVTGWYSDVTRDILNVTANSFEDTLAKLNWSANVKNADRTFYTGYAFCVPWDKQGAKPKDDELSAIMESKKINVAIGRNTADAQSALIGNRLSGAEYKDAERVTAMLRMLRYEMLEELDTPGGDLLVEERALEAGFTAKPGGVIWDIVPRGQNNGEAGFCLTDKEKAVLEALNAAQREYDGSASALRDMQRELHDAWFKRGHAKGILPRTKKYDEAFNRLFDRNDTSSLISRVIGLAEKTSELALKLPERSEDEYTYQKNIDEYAKRHGVLPENKLFASPGARFWLAGDPVVAITGVEVPRDMDLDADLIVRGGKSLIQKFLFSGGEVTAKGVFGKNPVFEFAGALPEGAVKLFSEYLLLDPLSAEAIAARLRTSSGAVKAAIARRDSSVYQGEMPHMELDVWQKQPWQPRYLEWKIKFFRTAHDGKNWVFNGREYVISPGAKEPDNGFELGGIAVLSSHETDVFKKMLEKHVLEQYPDALHDLDKWMESMNGWCFLTQRLSGLKKMLAQRDIRVFRTAAAELPEAGTPADAPYLNNGNALPSETYTGLCDGQFYFVDLMVYDKFGRALNLTRAAAQSGSSGLYANANFLLTRAQSLIPGVIKKPALARIQSPVQLNLSILQHAMLDIRFADHRDDTRLSGVHADIQPICAWLISNHIGHSIMLFTPGGQRAGELRLVQTASGDKRINWAPLSDDAISSLDAMRGAAPHLYRFVTGLTGRDSKAFTVLIDTIDSTLWAFNALGTARNPDDSPMAGRALALVRTAFRLVLDGEPLTGSGMDETFTDNNSPIPGYQFDLRLGNPIRRGDGLIGYFQDKDGEAVYDTLRSVIEPSSNDSYVRRIGDEIDGKGGYITLKPSGDMVYTTLLLDPVLAFHAATGILPVKEARVPRKYWKDILPKLELSFRMGPLLTRFQFVQEEEFLEKCIRLNTETREGWLWKEPRIDSGGVRAWDSFPTTPAPSDAFFTNEPVSLREGILQTRVCPRMVHHSS